MVVVHVAADNVRASAGVCGRKWSPVREDMQGPGVIHHGVTWQARVVTNSRDCVHNGLQRDAIVGVVATQPTNEVSDIEM